ncbi:protein phosphatase 2C domain-containing protein [Streptomyces populi]|uniref:protein phosphatase 2C domain-containing protein n=1 Tax=Streptomyces populi TaxID=2058924 RepID=UPI001F0CBBDE|nr:protein phosphatase 2C domain-containing protein [Streptomyces populi]
MNGDDVHSSYGEPGRPLPTGPGDSAAPFEDFPHQETAVGEAARFPAATPPAVLLTPQPAEDVVPSCEPTIELRRGVPAHVGTRPPTYPPHPLGRPSLRDGDPFAALAPVVRLDGSRLGRLTVRAASVRGDSHNWEGGCRQDAMVVTRIGPPEAEMLLLAVADGVGSARYSHIGSDRISQVAAMHLDREAENIYAALGSQDVSELRALASKAVALTAAELRNQWAASSRHQSRPYADADYATTLHVLLIPTDPGLRDRVLFSVGDGGLFVLREGHWENGNPNNGEGLLDTRTEALPHAYGSVKATLLRPVPGEVLLLGTDGITNPLTQKDPEFARHLADAWGGPEVPSLSDFLWQAQTRAKSYDDDRTVICVWEEGA